MQVVLLYSLRCLRSVVVSTCPFHGHSTGSNPVGDAYSNWVLIGCLFEGIGFTNILIYNIIISK